MRLDVLREGRFRLLWLARTTSSVGDSLVTVGFDDERQVAAGARFRFGT
jgi:hypothetical protein